MNHQLRRFPSDSFLIPVERFLPQHFVPSDVYQISYCKFRQCKTQGNFTRDGVDYVRGVKGSQLEKNQKYIPGIMSLAYIYGESVGSLSLIDCI